MVNLQSKERPRTGRGKRMQWKRFSPEPSEGRWPCQGLALRPPACTMLTEHISDSLGFLDYGAQSLENQYTACANGLYLFAGKTTLSGYNRHTGVECGFVVSFIQGSDQIKNKELCNPTVQCGPISIEFSLRAPGSLSVSVNMPSSQVCSSPPCPSAGNISTFLP